VHNAVPGVLRRIRESKPRSGFSDLPDLEPPISNVRVEATAKIIEIPAAPTNFFMLIGASLFLRSFPYLPIPVCTGMFAGVMFAGETDAPELAFDECR